MTWQPFFDQSESENEPKQDNRLMTDRTGQMIARVVLVATALDAVIGLVVWAVLHCLFGGE
jgi:hypothetical protein